MSSKAGVSSLFKLNKKAIAWDYVVGILVVVALAIVLTMVFTGTSFKAASFWEKLGPSPCTEDYKKLSLFQFNDDIVRFSSRESKEGVNYYDTEQAMDYFKGYLACKDNTESRVNREGSDPKLEESIKTAAKNAYVNSAEDLCVKFSKPETPADARKGIETDYEELEEEYYKYFGGTKMTKPYQCLIG